MPPPFPKCGSDSVDVKDNGVCRQASLPLSRTSTLRREGVQTAARIGWRRYHGPLARAMQNENGDDRARGDDWVRIVEPMDEDEAAMMRLWTSIDTRRVRQLDAALCLDI